MSFLLLLIIRQVIIKEVRYLYPAIPTYLWSLYFSFIFLIQRGPFFRCLIYIFLALIFINSNFVLNNRRLFHKTLRHLGNPDFLIFLIIPGDSYSTNPLQNLIHFYLIIIWVHQHLFLSPTKVSKITRLIILILASQVSYYQGWRLPLLNYFDSINLI